jgi:hypothetical protein
VDRQAELLEIVRAFHPGGRLPDFLNGRKQKPDEYRDDGDDHQQFDQREGRP